MRAKHDTKSATDTLRARRLRVHLHGIVPCKTCPQTGADSRRWRAVGVSSWCLTLSGPGPVGGFVPERLSTDFTDGGRLARCCGLRGATAFSVPPFVLRQQRSEGLRRSAYCGGFVRYIIRRSTQMAVMVSMP
ncbi:hypothetical protein SALB1_1392 [Salinisphaera sp. LB1]|nr:hypothetical protein SALB1_1392 [Salinisphaera sp. LB1]